MAGKNEVVTQDEVPAWLKAKQEAEGNLATQDTEALAGLGGKVPRVSLKGRKFRLIVEGEEIVKPSDTLDVVILAVEPEKGRMVKTFYINGYSSGDTEPPTCSSADGIRPDAWIQNPINDMCQSCPKNAFGSATSQKGKPSKACRDSKRLWVAIPDEDEKYKDLGLGMGGTVFGLGVPVTSLGSLSEFGKDISKNGYPLPAVITHLEMVDAEFPQIAFSRSGFLGESEGEVAISRNIGRDWLAPVSTAPALTNRAPSGSALIEDANRKANEVSAEAKSGNVNTVIGDWN